jgi:hypothetical protein
LQVGANAIAVGGTTDLVCGAGTIDRVGGDMSVTSTIASPEMFEGVGIGLETDIYGACQESHDIQTRCKRHTACGLISTPRTAPCGPVRPGCCI